MCSYALPQVSLCKWCGALLQEILWCQWRSRVRAPKLQSQMEPRLPHNRSSLLQHEGRRSSSTVCPLSRGIENVRVALPGALA